MPSLDNLAEILAPAYAAADQADWLGAADYLLTLTDPAEVAPQLLELSLRALSEGDFKDALPLTVTLVRAGDQAVPSLMALLRDRSATPEARWFSARILQDCPAPTVVKELASYLVEIEANPDPDMTELVVRTLVQFGAGAIDSLTQLLTQPPHRLAALMALSRIRHSQIIPVLLTLVDDPDPAVRAIVLEALSSFHDRQVPPLLIQKLTDESPLVRRIAAQGLGLRPELEDELQLVVHLTPLLIDSDPAVAIAAATSIGRTNSLNAASALFERQAAADCPLALQIQIIQSLGWIDRPEAIDFLQKILKTLPSESEAAIVSVRAIAQQRSSPALAAQIFQDYLQHLPANGTLRLKQELAIACGNFGGTELVNSLVQLLADCEAPVRWQASYCLKQGSEPIRLYLIHLLESVQLPADQQAAVRDCLSQWPTATS
jgi:HEAT repeat protein